MTLKHKSQQKKRTSKRVNRKNHIHKYKKYKTIIGGSIDTYSDELDRFLKYQITQRKDRLQEHITILRHSANTGIQHKSKKDKQKYLGQHKNIILANKLEEFINLLSPIYNFINRLRDNLSKINEQIDDTQLRQIVIDTINDANNSMMNYPLIQVAKSITPSNSNSNTEIDIKNCVTELYELLQFYYSCLEYQNQENYFSECENLENTNFQEKCPDAENSYLFKQVMMYLNDHTQFLKQQTNNETYV